MTCGRPYTIYMLHQPGLGGVGQLDRNGKSPLALFFSVEEWISSLTPKVPWSTQTSCSQMTPAREVSQQPAQQHNHSWAWGHRGCRGPGLEQTSLLCLIQASSWQHQLPLLLMCTTRWMQPINPSPYRSDRLAGQRGRGWPCGPLLSSGYSSPAHNFIRH